MSNWAEDEVTVAVALAQKATILPAHPDNSFYELDSDFRPQELMSLGSSRSGNFFSNRVQAAAYGIAISTMLRLRRLPGAVAWYPGSFMIFCEFQKDGCDVFVTQVDEPVFGISGYFDTMEQAEAAIETIGRRQILLAHKTLMCLS
jgi:hypothetical protein